MPLKNFVQPVRQADLVLAFGPIGDKVQALIDTEGLACSFYRLPAPSLLDRETGDTSQRKVAAEVLEKVKTELATQPREELVITAQLTKDNIIKVVSGNTPGKHTLTATELVLVRDAMETLGVDKVTITLQGSEEEKK